MEVPKRVTRMEDGTYYWAGKVDQKYNREVNDLVLKMAVAIALFVLLAGAIIAYLNDNWPLLLIVFFCDLIFLLISYGVVHGQNNLPDPLYQDFRLDEERVFIGRGKKMRSFPFADIEDILIRDGCLELNGKRKFMRVFVPAEDQEFVLDYIRKRSANDIKLFRDADQL